MSTSAFEERFELNKEGKGNIIFDEHLVRYEFAKSFAPGKEILEIACGSGYGADILARAGAKKVLAMDIDGASLKKAQKNYQRKNLEFKAGDAERIGLPGDSIGLLVSFETIEHLKKPAKFASEAARVLKDGGLALISTPNKELFGNKNPFHIREFTENEFKDLLEKEFKFVHIIPQRNALASYIDTGSQRQKIGISAKTKTSYFIAVCAQKQFGIQDGTIASLNSLALDNLYDNPGFKLANKIYSLAIKVPGFKKLIKIFTG